MKTDMVENRGNIYAVEKRYAELVGDHGMGQELYLCDVVERALRHESTAGRQPGAVVFDALACARDYYLAIDGLHRLRMSVCTGYGMTREQEASRDAITIDIDRARHVRYERIKVVGESTWAHVEALRTYGDPISVFAAKAAFWLLPKWEHCEYCLNALYWYAFRSGACLE